ncbi:NAD(P)/FAD-dependent oxidoreductase [Candidatus Saccharibacteria bacterium]|nr:NAD(P)/FAD-dependent oxidoreductase [Candidatus Saccharibacteria bacterium]
MAGKKFDYDLVVIGSGAAGGTAALMAAGAGLSTALVEAGAWGGTNINRRDIPYAAASHFSQTFFSAIEASKFGLSSTSLKYNYPSVLNWNLVAQKRAGAGSKKEFEAAGVKCISGFAQFISPNEISVGNNNNITAKKFIIATGATPIDPGITGSSEAECLLPEEVFTLRRVPKVVMVVGGGSTGCEVAEYLAEMGSKVLLTEISERLLPKEDPEAGEVIEKRFSKALGIKVLTSSRVVATVKAGKETLPNGRKTEVTKVSFMRGGQEKSVKVEAVVIATGSEPAVDLGLSNAEVQFSSRGIKVNATMQTSAKHIYAVGDVADATPEKHSYVVEISSTEKASYEAAIAASNIVNKAKGTVDYRGFVRMTDTFPKVASTGLTEDECIARDLRYTQTLVPISSVSASNTQEYQDGFVKLITNREHKIIGATIVAPNADLLIQEIVIAMKADLKLIDIASTPHIALGWGEAVRVAARRASRG